MEPQLVCDFCSIHRVWKVLQATVGENLDGNLGHEKQKENWKRCDGECKRKLMECFSYLFISKHQEYSVTQLVFVQHSRELFACLSTSLSIIAVHHED